MSRSFTAPGCMNQILFTINTIRQMMTIVPTIPYPSIINPRQ